MFRKFFSGCFIAFFSTFVLSNAIAAELRIVGTGDGMDYLKAIGEAYTQENSNLNIVVPPSVGSGGGIIAVAQDREMLARVARPLTDEEKSRGLVEKKFAKLPSAFFVHQDLRVGHLTTTQLADIFSGKISNWKDVGGPDLKIKVVRREEGDSTLGVLRKTMPHWSNLVFSDRSKMAVTTQDAIQTTAVNKGAIGFGPFTKMLGLYVNVLKIDQMHPTDEAYPSAVVLSFVYKPQKISAEAKQFVDYSCSEKSITILSSMGGVAVKE